MNHTIATRALAALLPLTAAVAGAQEEDPLAPFLALQGETFVLERLRVVDGTGAPARPEVTLVIRDGVIAAVGAPGTVPAPPGATRLELAGHTALPGLVMLHEHLNYFSGRYVWDAHPGSVPKLLLAAGVTTARTAGSEAPQVGLALARRIDAGQAPGPRLHVTGPFLNDPAGGFLGDWVVADAEEGRRAVATWADYGVTSFKVYDAISADALAGVIAEAHRRGLRVTGHLHSVSCAEAAALGIDSIEHSFGSCLKDFGLSFEEASRLSAETHRVEAEELIATLVENGVALVSTPASHLLDEKSELELAMLSDDQRARFEGFRESPPPWAPSPAVEREIRKLERAFAAAGGTLLVGADAADFGAVPGFANHKALRALVDAGFDPLEVIRFATLEGARFLAVDETLGTIAPGKAADVVVVKGAPDRSIGDIENVAYVFQGGRAFDPGALREAAKGMLGRH